MAKTTAERKVLELEDALSHAVSCIESGCCDCINEGSYRCRLREFQKLLHPEGKKVL